MEATSELKVRAQPRKTESCAGDQAQDVAITEAGIHDDQPLSATLHILNGKYAMYYRAGR